MPTNLYGPGDNFDPESAHVLAALIRRFDDAVRSRAAAVTNWGTGSPRREFLHVKDLATAVLHVLERYDESAPINIGTGVDIAVSELAEKIAFEVGFKGNIKWDHSMPDGTPRKVLDISRIRALGWEPTVSLDDGLRDLCAWYARHQGSV
jgi:GDP-L-fucose synthase